MKTCCICFEEYESNMIYTTTCKHDYCKKCIIEYMLSKSEKITSSFICAICRKQVRATNIKNKIENIIINTLSFEHDVVKILNFHYSNYLHSIMFHQEEFNDCMKELKILEKNIIGFDKFQNKRLNRDIKKLNKNIEYKYLN